MLSTKDLVFKKRPVRKLTDQYIGLYIIEEVVSANAVKLKLPVSIRIHSVIDISRIVRYEELVKEKKIEKLKPIEVDGKKKWKIKRILNKRVVQGCVKYLVR